MQMIVLENQINHPTVDVCFFDPFTTYYDFCFPR